MADVRHPVVPGALNFRDVGGLPAAAGRTRPGVLFRSGNLSGLEPSGREALGRLGLRRVVDLRDDAEVAYEPTDLGELPVEVERVPLLAGSVASFFESDITLASLYRSLVDDSGEAIVRAVRGILGGGPVLIHCTVGKDRTGVTVALALAAVDVEVDAIVADYARTEAMLPPERNAKILAYLQRAHPDARHLVDLATRSPAPVMRELLDDLSERYGSPADFLHAHGLTSHERDQLRRTLVSAD